MSRHVLLLEYGLFNRSVSDFEQTATVFLIEGTNRSSSSSIFLGNPFSDTDMLRHALPQAWWRSSAQLLVKSPQCATLRDILLAQRSRSCSAHISARRSFRIHAYSLPLGRSLSWLSTQRVGHRVFEGTLASRRVDQHGRVEEGGLHDPSLDRRWYAQKAWPWLASSREGGGRLTSRVSPRPAGPAHGLGVGASPRRPARATSPVRDLHCCSLVPATTAWIGRTSIEGAAVEQEPEHGSGPTAQADLEERRSVYCSSVRSTPVAISTPVDVARAETACKYSFPPPVTLGHAIRIRSCSALPPSSHSRSGFSLPRVILVSLLSTGLRALP